MRPLVSTTLAMACACGAVASAHAERYWASMRGGEIQTGERLRQFEDPQDPVELDGKKLLEGETPVRTIRDTELSPARRKPFLELTNGDVLLGRVREAVVGQQALPLPDHVIVEHVPHTGEVRVRLDCIRRLVTTASSTPMWCPGRVMLTDGSLVPYRSLRWSPAAIKVLTDETALSMPFDQFAEVHLSPHNWQSLSPGAAWLADETPSLVRVVTAEGQVMTFPKTMVTRDFSDKRYRQRKSQATDLFATKPAWSLDPILIDRHAIAWQSYFDGDEVPLSTLPVVNVVQHSALHHGPWRLNRSVHGGDLCSGAIRSELGVGMRSHNRVSFQLPPGAKSFATWVGLNQLAGSGGCVHCRIWRDEAAGTPLWERKFLTGVDGVQEVGPLDISGAQRLILEVDFAHKDRPAGADPLDIRDMVDWLMPIVRVDPALDMEQLTQLIPEIAGWNIDADQLKRIQLRPFWLRNDQWGIAIATGEEPLVLSRQVEKITLKNAWLPVRATCDDVGDNRTIGVRANGAKIESNGRGNVTTFSRARFGKRAYNLSKLAGATATVEVVADPYRKARGELGGVVWDWLRLRPLVQNLPAEGSPIRPDVPLSSLSPVRIDGNKNSFAPQNGQLLGGGDLNVLGWPLKDGFEMPAGGEVSYSPETSWHRFVAVIGLAEEAEGAAGPFQILLDDQLHWSSQQPIAADEPGQQISVPIPPGHKTITLRILGKENGGVWAQAGFLKSG